MKRIVIVLLVFMLIFLEGCSVIGYGIGSRFKKKDNFKEPFKTEEVEAIKINSPVEIESKDYGMIKGNFLSFANDTLHVKISSIDFNNISNNLEDPDLLSYNSSYVNKFREKPYFILMIPINRIDSVEWYGNKAQTFALVGLGIDVLTVVVTIILLSNWDGMGGPGEM